MKRLFLLAPFALLAACYGPPPPAPPITPNPPGGVYRAIGTTPSWLLTIDGRQMIFTDHGSGVQIVEPTPAVIGGIAGEIYQSPRIGVNIVHMRCTTSSAGAVVYPDRVQVTVDGRRYQGCGGH